MDAAPAANSQDQSPISSASFANPAIGDGFVHGFMGRAGGVSTGVFRSLNLARWVGDDPISVETNWQIWHAAHPQIVPAFVRQVHGNHVRTIDLTYDGTREPGDGMVTATPGIALCIFTADCVPILLVDPENRVVGALHAGWRGTLADIASEGVRAMVALGARPDSIHAALGPAVGPCCFEVDEELAERFARAIPDAPRHTRSGSRGKAYLDLRGIVAGQLTEAGVDPARIQLAGPCTKCASDRYFSCRAAGGSTTGLQMSFIGLVR
jgi:purine-nucleoside/S-methyl-5'-thioadenosine phosphorylase / adenosine deaminase